MAIACIGLQLTASAMYAPIMIFPVHIHCYPPCHWSVDCCLVCRIEVVDPGAVWNRSVHMMPGKHSVAEQCPSLLFTIMPRVKGTDDFPLALPEPLVALVQVWPRGLNILLLRLDDPVGHSG